MADKNQARWVSFWNKLSAHGEPLELYDQIKKRYSEPHRAYHTMEHIAACLDEFGQARDIASDPLAIELGIWYHDLVYNVEAKNNEERSADALVEAATRTSLSSALVMQAVRLIMATKHDGNQRNIDDQLIADIDLAILGKQREIYCKYARDIRKEYSSVSDKDYTAGRAGTLGSFANRPRIYFTDYFRSKYEARARQNLENEIEELLVGSARSNLTGRRL